MNEREIKTVKQEAARFSKDIFVTVAGSTGVKLELPYYNAALSPLYFFVVKRKGAKKFSLLLPVESIGVLPVDGTLSILQELLKTYQVLVSQEADIMEENDYPLHTRIKIMTQALVAIDGIRRLWQVEHDRRTNATESKAT